MKTQAQEALKLAAIWQTRCNQAQQENKQLKARLKDAGAHIHRLEGHIRGMEKCRKER